MAYSSGFNPHPRISYANAAPTSAASEAEYVELGLARHCSPQKVVEALNESLPTGFVVLDAADACAQGLGDLLQASDWEVGLAGVDATRLAAAVGQFLALQELTVERMTKNGMRSFDARAAVLRCAQQGQGLELRILHTVPLVRPDDVVTALRQLDPELVAQPLLTRRAQGPLVDGGIGDPLRP